MDKLLEILSQNSDFTNEELASMLNEPEDYIAAQIKEYHSRGIIKGYHATINWEKVSDADVTAIIELKVTPKPESGFDEMAKRVMEYSEVKSVYLMAGSYDFAIFVEGSTIQEVSAFVSKKLSALDGVISTATHFMLKCYKEHGVPLVDFGEDTDKRSLIL
ncbi:MAG: Lrp/AsnC family transcriptional regulator [Ruminococcus sp.]|nr:Lrp/AsnC family transcriptional regulator [Ruminococcus sp.]